MKPLRVLGVLGAIAGLVLSTVPTLVSDPGPAADSHEAIERRVWWGALTGFGVLLATLRSVRPWSIAFASFVFWIVAGFLAARVIGLVLDGTDSSKQWMWTAIEVGICCVAAIYLRRRGASSR